MWNYENVRRFDKGSHIFCCLAPQNACCLRAENVVVNPNPAPEGVPFTIDADIVNCGTLDQLAGNAVITGLPFGTEFSFGDTTTWPGIPSLGFVHKQWIGINTFTGIPSVGYLTLALNGNCGGDAQPPVVTSIPFATSI